MGERIKNNKKIMLIFGGFIILSSIIFLVTRLKPFKQDDFKGEKVEVSEVENEVVEQNEELELETDTKNILLLGVDSRESDFSDSRTDSIIIATIDPKGNKVKLTSIMRDTLVEIPNKGYQKINAAYTFGGVDLLKRTLKYNFNINIDTYMAIDFKGFQEIIDVMDGLDIEVKDYEVKEINKYIKEVNGGKATLLNKPGLQRVNGQQALSYSRIRKVGNGDYERMERQRRVLGLTLEKARKISVFEYPTFMTKMYPFIKSDMQSAYILKMANTVYNMENMQLENFRIPLDNTGITTFVDEQWVVIPKLKQTTVALMKFMYPEQELSSVKVPDNSFIINKAEVQKKKAELAKKEEKIRKEQNIRTEEADNTANTLNNSNEDDEDDQED